MLLSCQPGFESWKGLNYKEQVMFMKEDKQKQVKSPKKEELSKKDIEELMGTRRTTYKRVNGAVRRK
jgi:hypothetical protein